MKVKTNNFFSMQIQLQLSWTTLFWKKTRILPKQLDLIEFEWFY